MDEPPPGNPESGQPVDRDEAQHDVMMASLREALRSDEARVRTLADEAIGLGSQIAALQGRLAAKLAELDAADGCAGHRSVASWAGWHLGLPAGEARRLGKVAAALPDRPTLAAACAEGTIPLAAAAMVADITTPDNEAKVVALAKSATGPQVSKICADYRHATNDETLDRPDPAVSFTRHRGGYRLGGWLPALGGDTVKQGLQAELDRLWDEHHTTDRTAKNGAGAGPTRVDALVSLAERALADDAVTAERAEKYLTMIHVGLDGQVTLTDDTPVDLDQFRTILRDSSFSWILSLRGIPLWTTHTIRTANRAMRRALRSRDRHCAYPGCTNLGYLDAHHLTPYADQPETRLDGLVLLCWIHHHIVHDRGEILARNADGTITVRRADGTTWTGTRPAPTTTTDPPQVPTHHRAYAGDQLTHDARDVILHHLLGDRPIAMESESGPDPNPEPAHIDPG